MFQRHQLLAALGLGPESMLWFCLLSVTFCDPRIQHSTSAWRCCTLKVLLPVGLHNCSLETPSTAPAYLAPARLPLPSFWALEEGL